MKLNRICFALLLSFALISGAVAQQAPPPQQPKPAPGQPAQPSQAPKPAVPSGIQALPAPSSRDSVAADETVLTIGSEKITRARFEAFRKGLPPQAQAIAERTLAENYARILGLAMVAQRDKVDQSPEFQQQLELVRLQMLAQNVLGRMQTQSQQISDDEVKAYYNGHSNEMQQAKLKGIFVAFNPPAKTPAPAGQPAPAPKTRTDDEAKARAQELRKQILDGANFGDVAKANSDHQGSAEKAGDFGNVRRGMLPASLENAVFALKPKEVSEPIREGQGYYIFQVDEVRQVTLDEATANIRQKLQQEKFDAEIAKANAAFPVVYNDKYFGAAAPAPAATPGAAQGNTPAPRPAAGTPAQRPVITGVAPAQPAAKKP